jgi:hypothetical protein
MVVIAGRPRQSSIQPIANQRYGRSDDSRIRASSTASPKAMTKPRMVKISACHAPRVTISGNWSRKMSTSKARRSRPQSIVAPSHARRPSVAA